MSIDLVKNLYAKMPAAIDAARKKFGRGLTLAEKILVSHADDLNTQAWDRGKAMLALRPDRVAMQDATAQMAMLQFIQAGKKKAAVPSTIHCDHLIRAEMGSEKDLMIANQENREVYNFLASAAKKYGIGFWKPGAGIIHQVVLENYAFPGGLIIGTDSHTPNGGGLGMLAIGVGGADAGEVMAGLPWEVLHPKLIGVKLTGKLSGWASPKDVILYICGKLTVKGGTNKIVEYFGPGAETISATGKGTITNMGAELGATTSVFPFDQKMVDYLKITEREDIAKLAQANKELLVADPEVYANPEKYFDEIVEIDLSALEPHVVGPHSPDLARPISKLAAEAKEKGYPVELKATLLGSCTNSSYEDIGRAAHIAQQGLKAGLKAKTAFLISPGSERIFHTMKRDGFMKTFEDLGATVLANACGPCIGQWKRADGVKGKADSIVSTFNRNFPGRNDGIAETLSFLASPELVAAYALTGNLGFDPIHDTIKTADGKDIKLDPPQGEELPAKGFAKGEEGFVAPAENGEGLEVDLPPTSERLQLLQPFPKWDGKDFVKLPLLIKTKGKTTTDHISPAGPWLKFRGHLDKISDNMFLGANNAFASEAGKANNVLTGESGLTPAQVARDYKSKGIGSFVVGDENYGEGSSREHAAMSPRFLGVLAVLVKSFARIHETNLKKQGILPMTFANPSDYDQIEQEDRISVTGLASLAPGKPVSVVIHKKDGKEITIQANHSMTEPQITWFKAGSALNALN
ncbi:aconitate hydratase [Candidatus Nitronereus thalassa]|uniref:Aconitate hydratase A n=1 Tax=Candidatus Nitronereus thalassa TaxID=3020898 RepID=A0ABU3K6F3_9BACT|nr:aconitate hydratase [Candidatus Nitronereus thalassa]MDT7042014.1 aconitate hydratase [Candidatus Nitronereus thalassa]